ncbi:cytochrome P450, partial [Suillus lakei]
GGSLVDHPRFVDTGETLKGELSIIFTPAGSRWRRMRRALNTRLQHKSAEEYQPLQISHAKTTVFVILDDPANFQNDAATYVAMTITKIAYGKATPTFATDPEVIQVREHLRMLRTVLHHLSAYLVDTIPYLPRYGQELKREPKRNSQLYTDQLNRMKQQISHRPLFAKYMLDNVQLHGLTEAKMALIAGTYFTAGSDATAVAICTMLMAATCFPEEQAKFLDLKDVSTTVLTFADNESLPYLVAFITEALRRRPLIPGGGYPRSWLCT